MKPKILSQSVEKNPAHSEVKDISPKSLAEGLCPLVQLIDVREPEEFHGELGHIQGAKLLPLGELPDQGPQALDPSRPVVFICRSGGRSTQAGIWALENGCEEVYNLKGGMLAWQEAELPTN